MLIRDILPRLAELCPKDVILDRTFEATNADQQMTLMNTYIAAFNGKTSDEVEMSLSHAVDLRRELIDAKITEPYPLALVFDLLLVNLAGSVLGMLVQFGWLAGAAEWTRLPFVESSNVEIDIGQKDVELGPFLSLSEHPLTRTSAPYAIATWAGSAYYVCWRLAAYRELMNELFVVAMNASIKELNETHWPEALTNLTMVLQWGRAFGRPEIPVAIRQLEALALNDNAPELNPQIISFLLQGPDDLTVKGRAFLTRRARDEQTWPRLNPGERIGILSSAFFDGSASPADEISLWQHIADYALLGRSVAGVNRFEQIQQVDRSFTLIDAFALGLLKAGRIDDCVRLYRCWYGLGGQPATKIALIVPTASPPLAGVMHSVVEFDESDVQNMLDEVVDALRHSLSQPFNAGSGSMLPEYVPDRAGVANSDFDTALRSTVATTLRLADQRMKDLIFESEAQCVFFSLPLPTQASQINSWQFSRPITASLAKPLPSRDIRKIAIYAGTSLQTELEVATLMRIFEKQGINVDLFAPTDALGFESMYQNPTYDLIWFAGHGESRAYSPERAALLLDEERLEISVRRLSELVIPTIGQRLFVMNVCEAGSSPLIGRLPISGVAALISSPEQATVSHRWVTYPLVARAFGALLAQRLADGQGYFSSFSRALGILQLPKIDLINELRAIDGELAQSVENQSIEMDALVNCGSPIYQQ